MSSLARIVVRSLTSFGHAHARDRMSHLERMTKNTEYNLAAAMKRSREIRFGMSDYTLDGEHYAYGGLAPRTNPLVPAPPSIRELNLGVPATKLETIYVYDDNQAAYWAVIDASTATLLYVSAPANGSDREDASFYYAYDERMSREYSHKVSQSHSRVRAWRNLSDRTRVLMRSKAPLQKIMDSMALDADIV